MKSSKPGAKQEPDAWKTYCEERWGMSAKSVELTIRARPVLERLGRSPRATGMPSVRTASTVATLPEAVQELAILLLIVNLHQSLAHFAEEAGLVRAPRGEVKELARECRRVLWPRGCQEAQSSNRLDDESQVEDEVSW